MNNIIPLRAGESVDLGSFEIVKYENGIYEFAGLSEDIGKLPVVDAVKSGSNAYCIDTGEVYMYEKSSNRWFKQPSNGINETVVQSLSVTENGSYNAGTGKAYNPVTVNVPEKTITPLEITTNGTYDAGNNAAYNPIVVNVPQEGGGSGGGEAFYCWKMYSDTYPSGTYIYTNYDKTPDASAFLLSKRINKIGESAVTQENYSIEVFYEKTSDTKFITRFSGSVATCMYERYPSGDLTGGDAGNVSEDKLLCYYMYNGRTNGSVVYTDKPATKIAYGDVSGYIPEIFPVDDGGHLFMTNSDLSLFSADDHLALCRLYYTDGTDVDLIGKFVEHSE